MNAVVGFGFVVMFCLLWQPPYTGAILGTLIFFYFEEILQLQLFDTSLFVQMLNIFLFLSSLYFSLPLKF